MAKRKSYLQLLDEYRTASEAAALFESFADGAKAAAARDWQAISMGAEGLATQAERDMGKLGNLAAALQEKWKGKAADAWEALESLQARLP